MTGFEETTKLILLPEYGSSKVPPITLQSLVPLLKTVDFKSRFKISFRVSQPFRFTSAHA